MVVIGVNIRLTAFGGLSEINLIDAHSASSLYIIIHIKANISLLLHYVKSKSASVHLNYLLTAINFGDFIGTAVFAVESPCNIFALALYYEVAALG